MGRPGTISFLALPTVFFRNTLVPVSAGFGAGSHTDEQQLYGRIDRVATTLFGEQSVRP